MKFLKGALLIMAIGVLWSTSSLVKTHRLNQLEALGAIPYGPIPNVDENYYSYDGLESAFNSHLELKRADEFTKLEFENLILNSLDPVSKKSFKKYLSSTLNLSVEYQIDPFWIISVMMVESRFNFQAKSNKDARGLMQITPDTAGHLYQLMRKKVSEENLQSHLHKPSENIEIGVFYLKKLLHNFRMNYRLATIAYNIGPTKLRSLLEYGDIDTENFSYYLKVKESYQGLIKNFAMELKKRPYPFEGTYVVSDLDYLLTSENLGRKYSHSLPF